MGTADWLGGFPPTFTGALTAWPRSIPLDFAVRFTRLPAGLGGMAARARPFGRSMIWLPLTAGGAYRPPVSSRRTASSRLRRTRTVLAAWVAVFGPLGVLAAVVEVPWLRLAIGGLALVGALAAAVLAVREVRAEARERLLLIPCRVGEVDPYDIGVDREAVRPTLRGGGEERGYLPRELDAPLHQALHDALERRNPTMVVVRGPSKAGKSRTLFHAARNHPGLRAATLVAPNPNRDGEEALTGVLEQRRLRRGDTPLVLWLDDLEFFVGVGRGLHAQALDTLAGWDRPVVVLATAGGKGAELLADSRLSSPIKVLYTHPAVRVLRLLAHLSEEEKAAARERYSDEDAAEIAKYGIGEYSIAAFELERKLEEERHTPKDSPCPDGAAIVRAAIDWSRAGLTRPISEEELRELWRYYALGGEPTEERFQAGLAWARRPVYGSIALLEGAGSYHAYDYIVAYVDRDGREKSKINPRLWDRILELASEEEAITLAAVAARRGDWERAERALVPAGHADDPEVARVAGFNLGELLQERGDREGAEAAYRRADAHGHAEAAVSLGLLLQERGDLEGAKAAYRRADQRGHAGAANNLGVLLFERGHPNEIEEAEAAFRRAEERGDPGASFNLGLLLGRRGDREGAEAAYRRADERGDAWAASNLGALLYERGDLEGAEAAYRRAEERGDAGATSNLGVLLRERGDLDGAEAAFRRADERGDAGAANNLGALLYERGDLEGAEAAYRRGDERGDAGAAANLGFLLQERCDLEGAEAAFRRGDERGDAKAANELGALLETAATSREPRRPTAGATTAAPPARPTTSASCSRPAASSARSTGRRPPTAEATSAGTPWRRTTSASYWTQLRP
jgi:Flp pilus assembly protein TadD